MGGNDDPKKMAGPLPTLFIGVGPGAEKTLAELSRMARALTAPIHGPFGLVLTDSHGEELFTCDWPRACDFPFPAPAQVRERSALVGREEEKLATSFSFLVRRLRSMEPGVEPVSGGRIRMSSYVVIDLSDAATVASAVRMMQVLRRVEAAVDTTVLALTGRTAATDAAGDGKWFETWKMLLEQLQDGLLAQRVYLLDGCDTDKTWLERPEQLYRLGGEFLFYYGLACRGLLRQNERARTGAGESLLTVCGSFGCRTIPVDLSAVAGRIAERVAREDLAELYKRTVPSAWLVNLHEHARSFVDRIATICERAYQAGISSPGERRNRSGVRRSENAEIAEVIHRTITQVCSREPLVSLCLFFQLLRPKLARLLTQQRLWERARIHHVVAEALRRQEESTYAPMRTWLSQPETRWVDRFTPARPEVSRVAVSRPATMKGYLLGWLFLVIGLAAVAMGTFLHSGLFIAGGGLVSLAATVVMVWPTGWSWRPRNQLCEREALSAVPLVSYRMQSSRRIRLASLALVLLGLIGVTWPLWPAAWTLSAGIGAMVLAATTGIGLAGTAGGPRETLADQVSQEEAPGHRNPPVRWCRAVGLLCLALAWIVFVTVWTKDWNTGMMEHWSIGELASRSPIHPLSQRSSVPSSIVHLAGLVLVAVGIGVALFPRTGHTRLVDRVARMPQPLVGGIANPVPERGGSPRAGFPAWGPEPGLPPGVTALAAWVNGLALDPDQCLERFAMTAAQPTRETLFDFLAVDWESQLVQAFRQAVETRSGKLLKALALQPALWAQCITSQLQDPQGTGCELASLFALQAVKAWIESHTLPELLAFLTIDPARFDSLLGRLAAAHWPAPRVDPDMNVNVVAVGQSLWEVVARASSFGPRRSEDGRRVTRDEPLLVPLDWEAHDDKIIVLRAVQGLTQGWRGFAGMPGQLSSPVAQEPAPGPRPASLSERRAPSPERLGVQA